MQSWVRSVPPLAVRPLRLTRRLVRALAVIGVLIVSVVSPAPATAAPQESDLPTTAEHELDRICRYLDKGTPNQVAAARRSLSEEIKSDQLGSLRAHLERSLSPGAARALHRRFTDLVVQQLQDLEERIERFEEARVTYQRLRQEIEANGVSADAPPEKPAEPEASPEQPSDPDDAPDDLEAEPTPAEVQAERRTRLRDLRATRERTRREIRVVYDSLLEHDLALAPALFARQEEGAQTSLLVRRFYVRLTEDLQERVLRRFPKAPNLDALSRLERRSLVPLIETLREYDPENWDVLREEIAMLALELFASYSPEDLAQARQLFLELGGWGVERLDRWVASKEDRVPVQLRRLYAEWNRLGAPVEVTTHTSLPLAQYRELPAADRQELIYRLEWVAASQAIPVFARLLSLELDLSLQVEAAAALARLSDPRGAEFLRRLGLENAVELESISRQVLLIEAIHRRESGDLKGALEDLLSTLRRFPDDPRVHYEIGFTALLARQFELSIFHFQKSLASNPDDHLAHYNLSCCLALAGQIDAALVHLRAAIANGFRDRAHIGSDPDLKALRDHPEFQAILRDLE